MLLLTHIVIALTSLVLATILVIRPSKRYLLISNGFIGATLVSGSLLIFEGANLFNLCLSGLMYTIIAVGMTVVARYRLAALTT